LSRHGRVRKLRPFFTGAIAVARNAVNPLSVVPLLLARHSQWRTSFRIGKLVVSARRADLTAISECADHGEYDFVTRLAAPADALILDLGANVGCFSALVFSHYADAEVHSVEPSPDTFRVLERNRRRYPRLDWHVHRLAIAATTGRVTFTDGGASTARRLIPGGRGVDVEAERFSAFVSRIAGSRPIFLCKMDIEGAELPIFAAGDVAAFEQIEHLVVEVHGGVEECRMVTRVLSSAFPQLETIARPTSSKPLIHAWRPRPDGAATTSASSRRLT
jgi:FkbM family methyltransferase